MSELAREYVLLNCNRIPEVKFVLCLIAETFREEDHSGPIAHDWIYRRASMHMDRLYEVIEEILNDGLLLPCKDEPSNYTLAGLDAWRRHVESIPIPQVTLDACKRLNDAYDASRARKRRATK